MRVPQRLLTGLIVLGLALLTPACSDHDGGGGAPATNNGSTGTNNATTATTNNGSSGTSTNSGSTGTNNATTSTNNSTSTSTNNASTGTSSTNNATTTPPQCEDDEALCDGACVATDTIDHCGDCDPCPDGPPNTAPSCIDRACLAECIDGFVDANGDIDEPDSDGCEVPCEGATAEVCDGIDNDCDGEIDLNDLDLSLDACPPIENARPTSCTDGACVYTCRNGFTDLNGDLNTAGSDGCECFGDPSVAEVCDGVDNNCNGLTDEPNAELVSNCADVDGAVASCSTANPEEPDEATAGVCLFACDEGRVDIDNDLDNVDGTGCECTITNGGIEICDGLDNNCDGNTDEEGDALLSNCADVTGAEPNACAGGACQWTCLDGLVDINGDVNDTDGDGCECAITNGGDEECDGVDNDCDGLTDDADDDYIPSLCAPNVGVCASLEAVCIEGTPASCDFDPDYFIANLSDPDLFEGFGRDGTLELVCDDFDGNCDGFTDENCCSEHDDNDGVFSVVQPSQNENRQVLPSVAVSPDARRIAVAWQDTDSNIEDSVPNLGRVELSVSNVNNTDAVNTSLSLDGAELISPHVAVLGDRLALIWVAVDSGADLDGESAVYFRYFSWDGTSLSAGRSIPGIGPNHEESIRALDVASNQNDVYIAWSETSFTLGVSGDDRIYISKLNFTDGASVPVELTVDQQNPSAINPSLSWRGDRGIAVWHDQPASPFEAKRVVWSVLNEQFEVQGSGSVDLVSDPDAQPAAVATAEGFWIAFVDRSDQSEDQVKLLRTNSVGQSLADPQIIVPSSTTQRSPQLVQTPDGVVLVWVEGTGAASQTLFVLLDDEGAAVGEPRMLWSGRMNYQPIAAAPIPDVGAVVAVSQASGFAPERVQFSTLNADGDRLCLP